MNEEEKMKEIMALFTKSFQKYTSMLFFAKDQRDPNSVFDNGTVFFLNTGTKKILVTCGHVIQGFLDKKSEVPDIYLGLTGASGFPPIDISDFTLIDLDTKQYDLATFEIPDKLVADLKKEFFMVTNWPPIKPNVGDSIFLLGFPGIHRHTSSRGLELPILYYDEIVSSVSSRHFVLSNENGCRIKHKFKEDLPDFGSLGGISGAGAFRLDPEKIDCFSFAGIAYEASDGENSVLFVHHGELLNSDGRILRE